MTNDSERLERTVIALLVAAVDRRLPEPDSGGDRLATMLDLVDRTTGVAEFTPQDLVFNIADTSATLIVALCEQAGIDPTDVMQGFEEAHFRLDLEND